MTNVEEQQTPTCCFAPFKPVLESLLFPGKDLVIRGTTTSDREGTKKIVSKKKIPKLDLEDPTGQPFEIQDEEEVVDSRTPSTTSPKSLASDDAESSAKGNDCPAIEPPPNLLLDLPSLSPVALFLSFQEISRVILAQKQVLESLTAPPPRKPAAWAKEDGEADPDSITTVLGRRLVAPVVEVKLETTDILKRVSPPHVAILRIWSRASVDEVRRILREEGPTAFRSLEKFVARGCSVHKYDADALAQVFAGQKMRIVNLEKNQLRDEVVQALVKNGALQDSRMDTLCIRFNLISDPGALAIAELLRTQETLETVNLKMNRVTDSGAKGLAEVLKCNRTLRLLNLRRQTPGLTDKTAKAMAEALDGNDTLRKLRLRRNKITDEGAVVLAMALERRFVRLGGRLATADDQGPNSFELDLEENKIGVQGGLALLRCLRKIGKQADAEFCLFGNLNLERADLRQALQNAGEDASVADDPRLKIELSKPESL